MISASTGNELHQMESRFFEIYLIYQPVDHEISAVAGGQGRGILVESEPDVEKIVKEYRDNLVMRFHSQLSTSTGESQVVIYPVIGYESWPLVYDLLSYGAYDIALARVKRDLTSFEKKNTIAEFEYVIGSIYHLMGDIDSAYFYLSKALPEITFGFGPMVESQIEQIELRREVTNP